MTSYLKLIHNGILKTVALYDGIDQQELSALLTAVFGINGKIVGVMGEKGLVVPLSLICKSPDVAPNSVCKILVVNSLTNVTAIVDAAPTSENTSQNIGNSVASDGAIIAEDYSQIISEDDSVEYVTQETQRFLNSLKSQKFLTPVQHRRLSELLSDNSNLLFAAYSVAISANDSEYFAEICKDLANSLETEQGQSACEAQDEVLQICDQLYINEKITENQLLYLRHLVLIREEAVATLYDEFQEHQSVPLLAKSLYDLANTHPFQTASSTVSQDELTGERGISCDTEDVPSSSDQEDILDQKSEEEEISSPQVPKRKLPNAVGKGLTGVISLMSRSAVISKTEASVLYELIEQENEYVYAAYELYEKNKNLEDLQDTLLRCVKLEIRKRVTDIQEKELEALQHERESGKQITSEDDPIKEKDEESDDYNDGDDDYGEDTEIPEEISLEDISLPTILQSLGVANLWEKTVPELFIKTVFISVIRNQLTVVQAKALSDLFHARYDLVHAAWEVFTVQRDTTDFIDTLRRVIRDVGVEEMREEVEEEMKQRVHSSASAKAEGNSGGNEVTPSTDDNCVRGDTVEQSLQDRKAEAMLAVSVAKRELLKHSLEMMVKQQMTTSEKAQDLYSRYLAGDVLADAAIEAYASDRDVGEFLDTLQVLANNSKEDLDTLMRAVAAENDQEVPSSVNKANEDIALSQIEEIVSEMLKSDMIGPGIAEEFRKLIKGRDARLIQAYNSYQQSKSGAELVNTLLKIVIAAVEESPRTQTNNLHQQISAPSSETLKLRSESAENANVTHHAAKENESTASPTVTSQDSTALDPEDQKTVVDILMRAKAIDIEQYEGLSRLISGGNMEIGRIFAHYEESKDVYALIDALKGLNTAVLLLKNGSASENMENKTDAVEANHRTNENEEGGEDENENYDEDFDEDDGVVVEEKFMQIIQNMRLSDLETAALRLAIAENDPSIRDAIDRFRSDLNEENLMSAMKEAARTVIQRTLSSRMGQAFSRGVTDDREPIEIEAVRHHEAEKKQKEGKIQSSPSEELQLSKSLLSPPKAAGSNHYEDEFDEIEDLEDDEENYGEEDEGDQDDEDEGDQGGSSLLLSQTARDHIFPILVQELVKENIIAKQDGRIILQEFAASNPVISSALDIYDRDNDMAQLVESLQQIVDNIQNV